MSQAIRKNNVHSILKLAEDGRPLCRCDEPASELTSRTERNPGRVFYKCGNCNYFAWKDELPPGPSQQIASTETQQQPPAPSQNHTNPSLFSTPTKQVSQFFATPQVSTPLKRSHDMSTGTASASDPRLTQNTPLSPEAKARRMQAILAAQRATREEEMGSSQSQPTSATLGRSDQAQHGSEIGIQTEPSLSADDDDEFGSNGFNDADLSAVDFEGAEPAAKRSKVKPEEEDVTLLTTQRSPGSGSTSSGGRTSVGAGMLLTPPRSSVKEVEDEVFRRDRMDPESPTQFTKKGKQVVRSFFGSDANDTAPPIAGASSFNDRLAAAIVTTYNEANDSQKTISDSSPPNQPSAPAGNSLHSKASECVNEIAKQSTFLGSIFKKMEEENARLQQRLNDSENHARSLERQLVEMRARNEALRTEQAALSATLGAIQRAISQTPSSTPVKE